MYLRVAGFTLHVSTDDPGLTLAPGRASTRFVIDSAPASPVDVEVTVSATDLADDTHALECLFDSGGAWRLYRHDRGLLFHFVTPNLPGIPYKTALVDRDLSRAQIRLHQPFFAGDATIDPLEYPLDELLVIALLGRGHGIEIHGCGVIDGDSGWLFVGQSGAGKSTMARLWLAEPDAVVLSDDRIVLRADDEGVWMYGTPWHGDEPLASPRRARLDHVFFLRHDNQNLPTAVRPANAVARLMTASFPPFHDAAALDFTLGFLDRVTRSVPCSELGFIPDSRVLPVIRETRRSRA